MTEITLYNTRTRRKAPFQPIDPGNVRMYVCGPTVYDRAHIGNARPVVVFDTLFRLLRHVYGAAHVTYVRNFTDVDDKINARAQRDGRGIREITDETIGWYHADMDALGALRPTFEPRATEYIGQMIAMCEVLIAREHAYVAEGHVLFSVSSYPEYGRLARRSLDEMRAGARVEVAPYKRDPMDFVLWKPSDADLPGWESPWGRGRPGWHIECSAMAHDLLGASFDIHGGGIDLAFPHHENELAQSCCAHPEGSFANVWMHNGFLQVEGEKMSKSLGNFFTVHDLLQKGVPGEVIRFVLLSTHYRAPIDWTEAKLVEALNELSDWRIATDNVKPGDPDPKVVDYLASDLNVPGAFERLRELFRTKDFSVLKGSALLLGLLTDALGGWVARYQLDSHVRERLDRLDGLRAKAKASKNFDKIDAINGALKEFGVTISYTKDGATIGSIDALRIFRFFNELSAEKKRDLLKDSYREATPGEASLDYSSLAYAYTTIALDNAFGRLR